jgi:Arc/MetJ family transcription regulator
MAKTRVTVRLDKNLLVRARKALGTDTVTETIEQALGALLRGVHARPSALRASEIETEISLAAREVRRSRRRR